MKIPVSIQAKKDFLRWFIQHNNIEAYEMNWFLNELIEDERILFHVHFVENIQYCPKGIIISTTVTNDVSFLFFKGAVRTEDVYTAYHEIQLYREDAIFLQVNFQKMEQNNLYNNVLENGISFFEQTKRIAEELLDHSLVEGKRQFLEKEINHALDNLDYEKFLLYSAQLKDFTNS